MNKPLITFIPVNTQEGRIVFTMVDERVCLDVQDLILCLKNAGYDNIASVIDESARKALKKMEGKGV